MECTFSNSIGLSIPSTLCRRWQLWKIARYSNLALANSTLAFHRFRFKSSVCIDPRALPLTHHLSLQPEIDEVVSIYLECNCFRALYSITRSDVQAAKACSVT